MFRELNQTTPKQRKLTHFFIVLQAYVTQDDNLIGTLTVRETIMYSAKLRLPDNMPMEGKCALVEATIIEMGLQECANTVIGNWHLRGISGGEKRRVSIAIEILIRPRLLFLDEPTSGLDRYIQTYISFVSTCSFCNLCSVFGSMIWCNSQRIGFLRDADIARFVERRTDRYSFDAPAKQRGVRAL